MAQQTTTDQESFDYQQIEDLTGAQLLKSAGLTRKLYAWRSYQQEYSKMCEKVLTANGTDLGALLMQMRHAQKKMQNATQTMEKEIKKERQRLLRLEGEYFQKAMRYATENDGLDE